MVVCGWNEPRDIRIFVVPRQIYKLARKFPVHYFISCIANLDRSYNILHANKKNGETNSI